MSKTVNFSNSACLVVGRVAADFGPSIRISSNVWIPWAYISCKEMNRITALAEIGTDFCTTYRSDGFCSTSRLLQIPSGLIYFHITSAHICVPGDDHMTSSWYGNVPTWTQYFLQKQIQVPMTAGNDLSAHMNRFKFLIYVPSAWTKCFPIPYIIYPNEALMYSPTNHIPHSCYSAPQNIISTTRIKHCEMCPSAIVHIDQDTFFILNWRNFHLHGDRTREMNGRT